jgi:NAD(P)-dependent dehydrogenase (short-subunit alcohol dehydrogenase family)
MGDLKAMTWTVRDKTCLITGANTGIGKETALDLALDLARRGAEIVMICRDRERGEAAKRDIDAAGSRTADLLIADLAVQADVRRVAADVLERHPSLPVVISNAGVVMPEREVTADGMEATFAINHLAPFLLINLLLDRIKASAPARIVIVASQVEAQGVIAFDDLQTEQDYEPLKAYRQSKLANVLFTYELARRLAEEEITVNCLHPGVIATHLLSDYMGRPRALGMLHRLSHPGPKVGAQTSIRLATDPELGTVSGRYFRPEGESQSSKASYDEKIATRLWEESERLTGLSA